MSRRRGLVLRLLAAITARLEARNNRVSRPMLRRLRSQTCIMPDGQERQVYELAEIAVLAPTGMQIARYRIGVDPTTLQADGTITAAIVPAHVGNTRLITIQFTGTRAIVPLTAIHDTFRPIAVDAVGGVVRVERRYSSPANSNTRTDEPDRPQRQDGEGLRLVHSR